MEGLLLHVGVMGVEGTVFGVVPGLPWIFDWRRLNKDCARLQRKAKIPAPVGHRRPDSNENKSLSYPYRRRHRNGQVKEGFPRTCSTKSVSVTSNFPGEICRINI